MTENDFLAARDTVDAVLARALKIVDGAPYWITCYEEETAQIDILEGGDARLTWWEAVNEYESCSLPRCACEFPAHLLFMPQTEFAEWKVDQKKLHEEKTEREQIESRAAALAQQRQEYERLSKIFGPKS